VPLPVGVNTAKRGRPSSASASALPSGSLAAIATSSVAPFCTWTAFSSCRTGARFALRTTSATSAVVVSGVPVPLPSSVAMKCTV
jgi:hypothetical protein